MATCGRVDLATMDVQLACNTNGVDTALRLWDQHAIPSVFVSSSLDQHTTEKAAAARPPCFLEKPVIAEVVAHFVKDHFNSIRM